MKGTKHLFLALSLVCLLIAAMLDTDSMQLMMAVFMFLFFQLWLKLVKSEHRRNSHNSHS